MDCVFFLIGRNRFFFSQTALVGKRKKTLLVNPLFNLFVKNKYEGGESVVQQKLKKLCQ